jgi:hypothetical protein
LNGTASTTVNPGTDAISAATLAFGSNSFGSGFASQVSCEFIGYPSNIGNSLTANQTAFY